MLNAVSSYYSNYLNPYAGVNYLQYLSNLYGSNSVFGNTSLVGTSALDSTYSLQTSLAVNNLSRSEASTQVRLSDLGRVKSGLDTLNQGLQTLASKDRIAPYKALSSDERIAKSSAGTLVQGGAQYVLNVSQLAQSQTLTSAQTLPDKGSTALGGGVLNIAIGSTGNGSFVARQSTNVYIGSGSSTLSDIANAINNARAGVSATVISDNSGYKLQISSLQSGSDNSLRILVNDNDNSDTNQSGLSQLAFDPFAAAGVGRNLIQSVAASNAAFSIDGINQVSQSNDSNSAIAGVNLSLVGTGTARIDVARDSAAFATAAQKLTDQYNAYLKTSEGADKFGVGAKIAAQLQNVLSGSSVGYGTAQLSLADIGIQRDTASGKLSINQTTLGKAFAANPENATQLLSNVATGLQDIAARNTGNTSELQTNTRQLQQTLQNIGVQRSLLYNYDELQVNGMQADSLSSLLNYLPSYSLTSPIARYLAVAGL